MPGRRYNKISIDDARAVSRSHGASSVLCGACPKWKNGFCAIFAQLMNERHLACKYGKVVMRAERQAKKWRKKKCPSVYLPSQQ